MLAIVGLILGIVLGIVLQPSLPPQLQPYLPIAIVAAFAFIDYWNAFLWPLIIITDPAKAPLQLGLSMFSGERGTDWGPLMAACSVAVAFSLIIVILMQRQLSRGMNIGGFGGR